MQPVPPENPNAQPSAPAGSPSFDFSSPTPPPAFNPAFHQVPVFTESTHVGAQPQKKGGFWGLLAALGTMLFKFKSALVFLKFGKLFTTMASMLVSIWFYALAWGYQFAVGFVLLIFVHEMGHVIAAKWKKIPVSAPMFIPGMGALITLKEFPRDALTEAYIGYGGPLLGTIGATAVWGLYYVTGNTLFLALATTALLINLFNMVPVSPLDGGRITAALSPMLWGVGLVGLFVWFLNSHSPIMLIILILGAFRFWGALKKQDTAYFDVSPTNRMIVAALYIGLALYLGWSQHYTHQLLEDWRLAHPSSGSMVIS